MLDFRWLLIVFAFIFFSSLLCAVFSASIVDANTQTLWSPVFGPKFTSTVTETGEYLSAPVSPSFLDKLYNTLTWSYPVLQQDTIGEIVRWGLVFLISLVTAFMIVSYGRSLLPF